MKNKNISSCPGRSPRPTPCVVVPLHLAPSTSGIICHSYSHNLLRCRHLIAQSTCQRSSQPQITPSPAQTFQVRLRRARDCTSTTMSGEDAFPRDKTRTGGDLFTLFSDQEEKIDQARTSVCGYRTHRYRVPVLPGAFPHRTQNTDSTGASQSGGGAAAAQVTMDTQHQQQPPQGGGSGSNSEGMKAQLQSAQMRLSTLHANRATASSELEEEAKIFMETPSTPEQERRLRLIFHLVQTQVRPRGRTFFLRQDDLVLIGECLCL